MKVSAGRGGGGGPEPPSNLASELVADEGKKTLFGISLPQSRT